MNSRDHQNSKKSEKWALYWADSVILISNRKTKDSCVYMLKAKHSVCYTSQQIQDSVVFNHRSCIWVSVFKGGRGKAKDPGRSERGTIPPHPLRNVTHTHTHFPVATFGHISLDISFVGVKKTKEGRSILLPKRDTPLRLTPPPRPCVVHNYE